MPNLLWTFVNGWEYRDKYLKWRINFTLISYLVDFFVDKNMGGKTWYSSAVVLTTGNLVIDQLVYCLKYLFLFYLVISTLSVHDNRFLLPVIQNIFQAFQAHELECSRSFAKNIMFSHSWVAYFVFYLSADQNMSKVHFKDFIVDCHDTFQLWNKNSFFHENANQFFFVRHALDLRKI